MSNEFTSSQVSRDVVEKTEHPLVLQSQDVANE